MKRCPSCSRSYDDSHSFCLDDGTTLVAESAQFAETVLISRKKSKLPIILVGMLALLVLGGTGVWFVTQRNNGDSQRASGNAQASPSPTPANNVTTTPSSAPTDAPQAQAVNAAPIATKDIGSLRVVLKSILPLKLEGGHAGMRCAFEFISLETQRPIVVAMNAIAWEYSGNEIGHYLRSTLVDENGGVWRLSNSDVAGMSVVGVGKQPNGSIYNPAEIVNVLSKRDELKSDALQEGNYKFVFGSTTEMAPGQSLSVTLSFVQETASGPPPKIFQIATEIVVGIVKPDTKKSYSLHNLTFDRVSLPAKES